MEATPSFFNISISDTQLIISPGDKTDKKSQAKASLSNLFQGIEQKKEIQNSTGKDITEIAGQIFEHYKSSYEKNAGRVTRLINWCVHFVYTTERYEVEKIYNKVILSQKSTDTSVKEEAKKTNGIFTKLVNFITYPFTKKVSDPQDQSSGKKEKSEQDDFPPPPPPPPLPPSLPTADPKKTPPIASTKQTASPIPRPSDLERLKLSLKPIPKPTDSDSDSKKDSTNKQKDGEPLTFKEKQSIAEKSIIVPVKAKQAVTASKKPLVTKSTEKPLPNPPAGPVTKSTPPLPPPRLNSDGKKKILTQ